MVIEQNISNLKNMKKESRGANMLTWDRQEMLPKVNGMKNRSLSLVFKIFFKLPNRRSKILT